MSFVVFCWALKMKKWRNSKYKINWQFKQRGGGQCVTHMRPWGIEMFEFNSTAETSDCLFCWRPSRALFLFELLHLLVFLFFPTKMNLIYLEIAHSVWRFCTKIFVRSQIKFTSITSVCDFIYYEKDSLKVDTQRWSDMNTGEPVIVRKMLLGDLCG